MSVKVYHSTQVGAPVLTGQAGALLAILDACLVNGFGAQTATSVVVSGGVCTVTLPSAHGLDNTSTVLLSGITGTLSTLNGERQVDSVPSATSYTFLTSAANGTATGTITSTIPSAGWAKTLSGTNLAAYQPTDVSSTKMIMRVDDTTTTSAKVTGWESLSNVTTPIGLGKFPTDAQVSGGLFMGKSATADATARPWTIVVNERTLFWLPQSGTGTGLVRQGIVFGDFSPTRAGDAYACILWGHIADQANGSAINPGCWISEPAHTTMSYAWSPRSFTQLGSSVQLALGQVYHSTTAVTWPGAFQQHYFYPNVADGSLLLTKYRINHSNVLRGYLPGVYTSPFYICDSFSNKDLLVGTGEVVGRKLMFMRVGNPAAASGGSYGAVFFDITGPWSY